MSRRTGFLVSVLVAFMAFTAFASGTSEAKNVDSSSKSANMNLTGLPIVKEKVTLKIAAQRSPLHKVPFAEMEAVKYFEEKTNVHIEWIEMPSSGFTEKANLMFASSDLPDAFFIGLTDSMVIQNGYQGSIVPLEKLIEQYAPNITKAFTVLPDYKKVMTTPDGHIYAIASVDLYMGSMSPDNLFINKTWLDKLGLQMPKTTEEYRKVLIAFKEKDPNGNGIQDEIPFTSIPGNRQMGFHSLLGAFGVLDEPLTHLMIKDGKVLFAPTEPGYRKGLEYMHTLQKDGLIDNEMFTQKSNQLFAKGKGKDMIIGSYFDYFPEQTNGADRVKDYAVLPPLAGPDGIKMWNRARDIAGIAKNTFEMTKANKYPEITMRWIDNIMDNGLNTLIFSMGPNGKLLKVNSDGTWEQDVASTPAGLTYDEYRHSLSLGNSGPFLRLLDLNAKFKMSEPQVRKLTYYNAVKDYMPKNIFPEVYYTLEIQNEVSLLKTDINKYMESMRAKFVLDGITDATWNEYVKTLKAMKLDRLMEIYQQTYDNYQKTK